MMSDVPPNDTFAPNNPEQIIGIIATIISAIAPIKIILLRILVRYSDVGFPGLIPGINPPLFFILLATSTGLNDKYERNAIKKAFGDSAAKLKINSTKSMIGHLLGAAGAVEAIAVALQMKNSLVHKTAGYKVPDEECDLDYCVDGNINMKINAALSNSLGFGGHNATICFKSVD